MRDGRALDNCGSSVWSLNNNLKILLVGFADELHVSEVRFSCWAFCFIYTLLLVILTSVRSSSYIYCLGFPIYNSTLTLSSKYHSVKKNLTFFSPLLSIICYKTTLLLTPDSTRLPPPLMPIPDLGCYRCFWLTLEVPMTPSSGSINLLEWSTELRETLTSIYQFTIKDIIKDTDEQPDVSVVRSGKKP